MVLCLRYTLKYQKIKHPHKLVTNGYDFVASVQFLFIKNILRASNLHAKPIFTLLAAVWPYSLAELPTSYIRTSLAFLLQQKYRLRLILHVKGNKHIVTHCEILNMRKKCAALTLAKGLSLWHHQYFLSSSFRGKCNGIFYVCFIAKICYLCMTQLEYYLIQLPYPNVVI